MYICLGINENDDDMRCLTILLICTINLLNAQSNLALVNVNAELETVKSDDNFFEFEKSFELVGGMVFIQADVNGQRGSYILDTGAPGIILNEKPTVISTAYDASSLNGPVEIGEVLIDNFEWGIINRKGVTGFQVDISHLENSFDKEIAGLIGFDVFADYELLFDYHKQTVKVYPSKKNDLHKNNKVFEKVSFKRDGHLPIIPIKIDGKTYHFGLDTGAEINILSHKVLQKVDANAISFLISNEVRGLDQKVTKSQSIRLNKCLINDYSVDNQVFMILDLSHVNANAEKEIDGILGFPFFEQHRISINYGNNKLYFWD